jgi:hypothetical protein
MTYIKDLINLPDRVYRGDFVLKLTEGVTRPAQSSIFSVRMAKWHRIERCAVGVFSSDLSDKGSFDF